jgi:hypothetical protein
MRILLIVLIFLNSCSLIPTTMPSDMISYYNLSTSCNMDSTSILSYSLVFQSIFDVTGVADSNFKVSCPVALKFINYTIVGSQIKPEPIAKKEVDSHICCLPF